MQFPIGPLTNEDCQLLTHAVRGAAADSTISCVGAILPTRKQISGGLVNVTTFSKEAIALCAAVNEAEVRNVRVEYDTIDDNEHITRNIAFWAKANRLKEHIF